MAKPITGQRTTANSKARTSSAGTTTSGPKSKSKKSSKKTTSKKSSGQRRELDFHPFPPGTKVKVYPAEEVGVERDAGREPFGKSTTNATVKNDGSLGFSGLEKGSYVAAGEVTVPPIAPGPDRADEVQWRYSAFSVK
jgi:hypothetical protein